MINIIVELSKYMMSILILIYTYYNFSYFRAKTPQRQKKVCNRQLVMLFMLHLTAYLVIYLKTENDAVMVFYLAQLIFLAAYQGLNRMFYHNISRLLMNNVCLMLCSGFIMLTRISMDKAMKQFVIVVAAAVITMLIPYLIDRLWQLSKLAWIYAGVGILLLLVVLVIGKATQGALLSLQFGSFSLQPSEFVKISFVFFVATMFYESTGFKQVVITTAVAAVHVIILVLSKDLGGALIFFMAYVFMLFAATNNCFYLFGGLASGSAAAVIAYRLFDHVKVRVAAWQNPWTDIDSKGYQITQSLFAIGTGGWFGMGLYQGMPWKIPVVEKDFIFSAISEELGGIYAICLLLICLGIFVQFMMLASKMQAMFYRIIAAGIGMIYIVQVFLTVGGVVKFIPSTGVTLPLVSYGGSSMASTFIMFGIIQGLYILKRDEEEELEYEKEQQKSKKGK